MTMARPAVAEVVADLSPAKPRANVQEVNRLSDTQGLTLWGHITPHAMDSVLAPGYFDMLTERRGGGLERHDRIFVTAAAETDSPQHFTLVVVDTDYVAGVKVRLLVEATAA